VLIAPRLLSDLKKKKIVFDFNWLARVSVPVKPNSGKNDICRKTIYNLASFTTYWLPALRLHWRFLPVSSHVKPNCQAKLPSRLRNALQFGSERSGLKSSFLFLFFLQLKPLLQLSFFFGALSLLCLTFVD